MHEPILLTVPQAAERLSLGRTTLYQLMGSGALRPVKIGKAIRIPSAEIERFASQLIEEQHAGTA